jgi:hypothetical protein
MGLRRWTQALRLRAARRHLAHVRMRIQRVQFQVWKRSPRQPARLTTPPDTEDRGKVPR